MGRIWPSRSNSAALVLAGSTLSLNPRFCWVDIWTFERTAAYSDFHSQPSIAKLNDIYRGHFLEHEGDQSWIGNLRDRLAARYREFILRLAQSQERSENWSLAAQIISSRIGARQPDRRVSLSVNAVRTAARTARRSDQDLPSMQHAAVDKSSSQTSLLIETLYQTALTG